MRRYLGIMLLAAVMSAGLAMGVNLLVDPYQQNSQGAPSWARLKPALRTRSQVFKARLASLRHDAVVLGTSRAEIGIAPSSAEWRMRDVVNLASSNQSYEETLYLLDLASANGTKIAVVGMDFFAANSLSRFPPSMARHYAGASRLATAASLSTFADSISTLVSQDTQLALAGGWIVRPDGQRVVGAEYVRSHGGHRALAVASEKSYLMSYYPPSAGFSLGIGLERSELNCFFRMLKLSHERKLQLYLFLSPSHARQWEALYQAGLWPLWEEWKRALAYANETLAREAGASPYPIVDFSSFNKFTTEEFPREGAIEATMRWYIESSHYASSLGELVLRRLLNRDATMPQAEFGITLSPATIDASLERIRIAHEAWRDSHGVDVSEIAASLEAAGPVRSLLAEIRHAPHGQGCTAH